MILIMFNIVHVMSISTFDQFGYSKLSNVNWGGGGGLESGLQFVSHRSCSGYTSAVAARMMVDTARSVRWDHLCS